MSSGSIGWQVPGQQYPSSAKKGLSSQVSSLEQMVPPWFAQVSSVISKSSSVLPFGRTNRLTGICRIFVSLYWVYVMFMGSWKCPEFSGLRIIVRFWISLGWIVSGLSISMKVRSDVIWMLVMFSSPKLNSWIVFWVSVFVVSSAKRSSGSCFRSSWIVGGSNSVVYIIGIWKVL